MIPALIKEKNNPKSLIIYRADEDLIVPEILNDKIQLKRIGKKGGKILFYAKSLLIILVSPPGSIINLYHLQVKNYIFLLAVKILTNSRALTYVKLDVSANEIDKLKSIFDEKSKSPIKRFKNLIRKRLSKYIDLFSCETIDVYKELSNTYIKDRVIYIPNGYWDAHINSAMIRKNIIKEKVIFHAARLGSPEKNSLQILRSFRKIPSEKNWVLHLAGPIEKDFQQQLLEDKKTYNDDKVRYLGNLSKEDLYCQLSKSLVFCLCSKWEGFPLVFGEAAATANLIVTSKVGGANEITNNGKLGVVLKCNTEENLTLAFIKISRMTEKEIIAMGIAQKEYANKLFSWEKICNDLNEALKKNAQ